MPLRTHTLMAREDSVRSGSVFLSSHSSPKISQVSVLQRLTIGPTTIQPTNKRCTVACLRQMGHLLLPKVEAHSQQQTQCPHGTKADVSPRSRHMMHLPSFVSSRDLFLLSSSVAMRCCSAMYSANSAIAALGWSRLCTQTAYPKSSFMTSSNHLPAWLHCLIRHPRRAP